MARDVSPRRRRPSGAAGNPGRGKGSGVRFTALAVILATLIALATGASAASTDHHHHRHHHPKPAATPTPKPTPAIVMRPMVLITGGTGTISVPTGESPAVLDSAELYDTVTGQFTAT